MLDRESILSADDLRTEDVDVPEWGGVVRIRAISAVERDGLEEWCNDHRQGDRVGITGLMARMVMLTACDAEGKPIFHEDDVEALNKKSAVVIARLFVVAQRLGATTDKDVEDLVGNFAGDRNVDSGSG